MTDLWVALFAALAGYFIGSISFARIIGKIVLPGEDLSETRIAVKGYREKLASQAVCATSLRERKGSKVAILTSFLDMLKAFVPVLACRLVFQRGTIFCLLGWLLWLGTTIRYITGLREVEACRLFWEAYLSLIG